MSVKVYGICDISKSLKIESVYVKKITKNSVFFNKRLYSYKYYKRIPVHQAAFSPEEAVKKFIEKKIETINTLEEKISDLGQEIILAEKLLDIE